MLQMEAMPLRDMLFWIFLTIFGTGTFIVFEHHVRWGVALIAIGVVGMVGSAWPHLAQGLASDPMMRLHQRLQGWIGFVVVGLVGAAVACGLWWLMGKITPTPTASDVSKISSSPEDEDSQYALLSLPPEEKAKLHEMKEPLLRYKAATLESPEYYKLKKLKDEMRSNIDGLEGKCGCLVDTDKLRYLPKPPKDIASQEVEINIQAKLVADEMSKTFIWVIRDSAMKLRVPITLFVSVTNRQKEPLKIDLLYLEAKSVGGWSDIRMADTLIPAIPRTMEQKPLVLEANNGAVSMKGDYLIPSLYDRVIQPGDKVEGWIIAEYPKGIKYGNSLGDMRISLLAANNWISSKIFPANPRVFDMNLSKSWYFSPLDTLIAEDQ